MLQALPLHELAALATALCWALSGLIAADGISGLGAFWFNTLRQVFVALVLLATIGASGGFEGLSAGPVTLLIASGLVGIFLGDSFLFYAMARIGPRRAGAIFALNAPMAALLGWAFLGERLGGQAMAGITLAALGVAVAVLGRPRQNAHRLEALGAGLGIGIALALCAGLGQALGTLIARPVLAGGMDPWTASLIRVGASGMAMAAVAALPMAPPRPRPIPRAALAMTLLNATLGLLLGMTFFLYALKGAETGIIATLSATSPVMILPLLWLRTGQRPTATSVLGAALAVAGLALIFTR